MFYSWIIPFYNADGISDPCYDIIMSFIRSTEMAKCFVRAKGDESEKKKKIEK